MTDQLPTPGTPRRSTYLVVAVLALLSVVFRVYPIPILSNFAALGALALFAGGRLPLWQSLLIVGALQLGTDLYLLIDKGWALNPFVYLSYPAYMGFGSWISRWRTHRRLTPQSVPQNALGMPLASFLGSTCFVLISDFGTWLLHPGSENPFYPHTISGLLACYLAGFIFSLFTYVSDLFFSAFSLLLEAVLSAQVDHESEQDYLADADEAESEAADPAAVPEPQSASVAEGGA